MKRVTLGSTGFQVSRLAYGAQTFRPIEANIAPEPASKVLVEAYGLGVNYWDTSDDYLTEPHVALGLKQVGRENIVLSTKTYEKYYEPAALCLEGSLERLQTDYVDIYFMHYVKPGELPEWDGCLELMKEKKSQGVIRAIGVSTHSPTTLYQVAAHPDVEVVYFTLNKLGFKIEDRNLNEAHGGLRACHNAGKGVYAIKTLAFGQLAFDVKTALEYMLKYDYVDGILVGMKSMEEVKQNVAIVEAFDS